MPDTPFLRMMFYIVFFVFLSFALVQEQSEAQPSAPLQELLLRAHGFCSGQQVSLERIQKDFVALKTNAVVAEKEFSVTLGAACKNVETTLIKMHGDKWHEYKLIVDKQTQQLRIMPMTQQQAVSFVQKVLARAKGEIESPIIETLLSYHPSFQSNPGEEFSRGFTVTYRTGGHPKAKGVDFQLQYPKSWLAMEGKRPNVIQFFSSSNGYGQIYLSITAKDLYTELKGHMPVAELQKLSTISGSKMIAEEILSKDGLDEMIQNMGLSNIKNVSSTRIVIDGWPGAMIDFYGETQRLDSISAVFSRFYFAVYKNYLISVHFQIYQPLEGSHEALKKLALKHDSLFRLVANSVVIQSQY